MKIIYNNENFKNLGDLITLDFLLNNAFYVRLEGYDYYIHYFNWGNTLLVRDITNAGKIGKDCFEYRLDIEDNNFLNQLLNNNFDDMFCDIALHKKTNKIVLKAIDVFNPFTIKETYKPLTKTPKKWTLKHALRAIVQDQYTDLKCDGQYTDDYAFDNAVDFQRGAISNVFEFLRKIIENKSGWKVYADNNKIDVNCYSFDTNSFIFKGVA